MPEMILLVLSYLAGVLTIASPCILPVLPFVFARADRPFLRSSFPLLLGLALTFTAVAVLAAVGGAWVVQANSYGRLIAMVLLAVFGVALLWPRVGDELARPLVALGNRLSLPGSSDSAQSEIGSSFLLGIATGLLWAPCAGPILGLILTGAALQGANAKTTFFLLTYAAGAATSLALVLSVGGRVFTALKASLGAGEWIRKGLGIAVLAGVAAIALGLDTGFLTHISLKNTASLEQRLLHKLTPTKSSSGGPAMMMTANRTPQGEALPVEGTMPSLAGAEAWLNSPPLTADQLKGKVVLVDFWTYSCINCLRTLPYVRAWAKKYGDHGLVIIGVHTPEFAFEKDPSNVKGAVGKLDVQYPVALDNNYKIWNAFNNDSWPAHYLIDAKGRIREHHFGEGDYAETEQSIRALLKETGQQDVPSGLVNPEAQGSSAAADYDDVDSPETYIGYQRFVGPHGSGPVHDVSHDYDAPREGLPHNAWGFRGLWTVGPEMAVLDKAPGGLVYHFYARDLHLVLGPNADGTAVRFRVTVDGAAPGDKHGTDVSADGSGVVTDQRLYQLVRQNGGIADRTFEIEFLDPGVHAYAFTFG
jgi:cytochrome c biogenesis protein CcdA/thiol-disulfide isomerase/thioredoxin